MYRSARATGPKVSLTKPSQQRKPQASALLVAAANHFQKQLPGSSTPEQSVTPGAEDLANAESNPAALLENRFDCEERRQNQNTPDQSDRDGLCIPDPNQPESLEDAETEAEWQKPTQGARGDMQSYLDHFAYLNGQLDHLCTKHPGILGWKLDRLPQTLDHLKQHEDLLLQTCKHTDQNMTEMKKHTDDFCLAVTDKYDKLDGTVTNMVQSLHDTSTYLGNEAEKTQQTVDKHHEELDQQLQSCASRIMDQMELQVTTFSEATAKSLSALDTQTLAANAKLDRCLEMHESIADFTTKNNPTEALGRIESMASKTNTMLENVIDSQKLLTDIASQIVKDVSSLQEQENKHSKELHELQDEHATDQNHRFKELTEAFRLEAKRNRSQVNGSVKTFLSEVARVQKALQVDYVLVSDVGVDAVTESFEVTAFEEPVSAKDKARGAEGFHHRRVRDFTTQTEGGETKTEWVQTDAVQLEALVAKKQHRRQEEQKKGAAFSGAEKLRKQAKLASMKRPYSVFDYYHEEGIAQRIAKSLIFENISLAAVVINALWISIDTEFNDAALLIDAEPLFFVMENAFTIFFMCEILVRFLAFAKKRNCLRDGWFMFDACLVTMMVLETWVVMAVFAALGITSMKGLGGTLTTIRMVRLVRIARLSRMARLLRAFPELLIIIKALKFAARSVSVFFLLWILLAYTFAVGFRQITEDHPVGEKYFPSIPHTMSFLLLTGLFGDSAPVVEDITDLAPWMWPLMIFFLTLVSLTTMYMLVGVLVELVQNVAASEKEGLVVSHLATKLRDELERLGHKQESMELTQMEFQNLLMEPKIVTIMQEVGVDVIVLADMLDLICEDVSQKEGGTMTFPDIVDTILSMRGSNPSTVKDIKEQTRITKILMKEQVSDVRAFVTSEMTRLRLELSGFEADDNADLEHDPDKDVNFLTQRMGTLSPSAIQEAGDDDGDSP